MQIRLPECSLADVSPLQVSILQRFRCLWSWEKGLQVGSVSRPTTKTTVWGPIAFVYPGSEMGTPTFILRRAE